MRMWMVNPKIMCRKHLLGEHTEIHMFVGCINRKMNLKGYMENNLLDFKSLHKRHDELAMELKERGYKHKSDLLKIKVDTKKLKYSKSKVNKEKSLQDLLNRCDDCKKRYDILINKMKPLKFIENIQETI